jgi:hypothetical protein
MPIVEKVLGQSAPVAGVTTDIYTVPPLTSTTCSTILVANRTATTDRFRISVAPGGIPLSNEQYISFSLPIGPNDMFESTVGITIQAGDVVRVRSNGGNLSFNLFGIEKT